VLQTNQIIKILGAEAWHFILDYFRKIVTMFPR